MSGLLALLDLALGLVFVYLLFSLIVTTLTELVEAFLKKRGRNLWLGMVDLLHEDPARAEANLARPGGGDSLVARLYHNPRIYALYRGKPKAGGIVCNLPSYLPPAVFAAALVDELSALGTVDGRKARTEALLAAIDQHVAEPGLNRYLKQLTEQAKGNLDELSRSIQDWYTTATDRMSGWYTRHARKVALLVGLWVSLLGNLDTLTLARALMTDRDLRQTVVVAAEAYAESAAEATAAAAEEGGAGDAQKTLEDLQKRLDEQRRELRKLGLPVGWGSGDARTELPESIGGWLDKIVGLLLTGIALSLGAPFWFDTLNRFMQFRTALKPAEAGKK